jgi:hypothetical protein
MSEYGVAMELYWQGNPMDSKKNLSQCHLVALQSLKDLGRLTHGRFLELFRHLVGLLGRVISPSQGLYLYRTAQYGKTRTNILALSGIRTHDSSVRAMKAYGPDQVVTVICVLEPLFATNPSWTVLGANPGLRGKKPATNRLSCGTACYST